MSALFLRACISGSYSIVRDLVESGVEIDAHCGMNGLHWAVRIGHKNIIPILIESGIDVNVKDKDGENALHHAVTNGHKNIIPILIESGIDINAKTNYGWNALHLAVIKRRKNIIQILIESGIDINAKTNYGCDALLLAVSYGHKKIERLLVEAGCALNENDLRRTIVQDALEANNERREGAKNAMAEIDFPRRAAGSTLDSDFPQIRDCTLSFVFLLSRAS